MTNCLKLYYSHFIPSYSSSNCSLASSNFSFRTSRSTIHQPHLPRSHPSPAGTHLQCVLIHIFYTPRAFPHLCSRHSDFFPLGYCSFFSVKGLFGIVILVCTPRALLPFGQGAFPPGTDGNERMSSWLFFLSINYFILYILF